MQEETQTRDDLFSHLKMCIAEEDQTACNVEDNLVSGSVLGDVQIFITIQSGPTH